MGSAQNSSRRLLPLAIAMALCSGAVGAANIVVTSGGDSSSASSCTLRQAIASANNDSAGTSSCAAGSGDDIITFAAGLQNSTITLSGGELDISTNLTLTGSGQTISGGGVSRVLSIAPFYYVNLSDLTISGGSAPYGAGILVSLPSGRTALKGAHGHDKHAIHTAQVAGQINLSRVTVSNNSAVGKTAGIIANYAYLTIDQSTISGNTVTSAASYAAGGLYSTDSTIILSNSTVSGNSVTGSSDYATGGVYVYNSYFGAVNVTMSGNRATGGNYVAGAFSATQDGGTKYSIFFDSTISGNQATGSGTEAVGGVLVGADLSGDVRFVNTIVSSNTGKIPNLDVGASATAQATSSLLGSELQSTYSGNGNVFSSNPGLGPLANNGGPTKTMALLAASPAIDAGDNSAVLPGLTTDQRGPGFVRISGTAVDIGSFERQVAAPSGLAPAPTLSTWASAAFVGLFALFGIFAQRKRAKR